MHGTVENTHMALEVISQRPGRLHGDGLGLILCLADPWYLCLPILPRPGTPAAGGVP
jgi:hypothetical protein